MSPYLSYVVNVIFSDWLSCQALERHVRLGPEDDVRHASGGGSQRGLARGVDAVDVAPVLQQRHHDSVQGQEVRDDLLVGDNDVEWSVLGSINSLQYKRN